MDSPFLKEPNHSSTRCISCFRAPRITLSSSEKSNTPSSGSMSSQVTQPKSVLILASFIFRQTVSMYSDEVKDEFWSSPASIRNGLPLTCSCLDHSVGTRRGVCVDAMIVPFSGSGTARRSNMAIEGGKGDKSDVIFCVE